MLKGPKLEESDVLERVTALFQTFESGGGRTLTRSAVVFTQRDPRLTLDGATPAVLLWTVAADSRAGNTWEVQGFPSGEAAEAAAIAWLGSDRRITWEQLAGSALVVVMSTALGEAWR